VWKVVINGTRWRSAQLTPDRAERPLGMHVHQVGGEASEVPGDAAGSVRRIGVSRRDHGGRMAVGTQQPRDALHHGGHAVHLGRVGVGHERDSHGGNFGGAHQPRVTAGLRYRNNRIAGESGG